MTTRDEHLALCKQRALEYLDNDPKGALASMLSDLRKHPETQDHAGAELGMLLLMTGNLETAAEVRAFIEGFN